jgi:hypothetical protein
MFEKGSRYENLKPYEVSDHRARKVMVIPVPERQKETSIGIHIMKQGQRLDHLAQKYLDDSAGYWRICELNDVMLPETLTEAKEIAIPCKRR